MPNQSCPQVRQACYRSGKQKAAVILGIGLIIVGVFLLILCVPLWAWLAVAGALLIVLGLFLLHK